MHPIGIYPTLIYRTEINSTISKRMSDEIVSMPEEEHFPKMEESVARFIEESVWVELLGQVWEWAPLWRGTGLSDPTR